MGNDVSAREIYAGVVGYVEHNTGGIQPPLIHDSSVVCSVSWSHPDEHPSRVRSAISAATSRNDLFRYVDDSSEYDRVYLGIDDADALERKIREYHERSSRTTRSGAIRLQVANRRVEYLRGECDE